MRTRLQCNIHSGAASKLTRHFERVDFRMSLAIFLMPPFTDNKRGKVVLKLRIDNVKIPCSEYVGLIVKV